MIFFLMKGNKGKVIWIPEQAVSNGKCFWKENFVLTTEPAKRLAK